MDRFLDLTRRVCALVLLSSLILAAPAARSHEVLPAIADMEVDGGRLTLTMSANLEGFVSGIDLGDVADTNAAPEAATYDALRALPPEELEARVTGSWPAIAERIDIRAGPVRLPLDLVSVDAGEVGDVALLRESQIVVGADLPVGASSVSVGWDRLARRAGAAAAGGRGAL